MKKMANDLQYRIDGNFSINCKQKIGISEKAIAFGVRIGRPISALCKC